MSSSARASCGPNTSSGDLALGEEGRASLATVKRIRTLERELARKEKALAEAAALLVLKKNPQGLAEDEGDETDEENEP